MASGDASESSKSLKSEAIQICAYSQLLGFITCKICTAKFKDPRILPCGHTFCLKCIQDHLAKETGHVRCMECDVTSRIDNVNTLLENISVANMIKMDKVCIETNPMCAICNDRPSITECEHCGESCCTECVLEHKEQLLAEISLIAADLTKVMCFVEEQITAMKEASEITIMKATADLNQRKTDLLQSIDEQSIAMIQMAEKAVGLQNFDAYEVENDIRSVIQAKQELIQATENVTRNKVDATVSGLLEFKKLLTSSTTYMRGILDIVNLSYPMLHFHPSPFEITSKSIGEHTINDDNSKCFQLVSTISPTINGLEDNWYPCSVEVDWKGNLVVVDRDNCSVKVFHQPRNDGEPSTTSLINNLNKPRDICCDYVRQLYFISDEHRVLILDSNGVTLKIIGSYQPTDPSTPPAFDHSMQFNQLSGVCVGNDRLFIADCLNDRICVVCLNKMDVVGAIPLDANTRPYRLCFMDGKLVYTSLIDETVVIINEDGNVIRKIGSSTDVVQISQPTAIRAFNGLIFVTSKQSIMVFTSDGDFHRQYTHPVMKKLQGLAICDTFAYVADILQRTIFVLQGHLC